MDKASIIGDAVTYMYELKSQSKKLKSEVAGLEASLAVSKSHQGSIESSKKIQFSNNNGSICKKIVQVCLIKTPLTYTHKDINVICNIFECGFV